MQKALTQSFGGIFPEETKISSFMQEAEAVAAMQRLTTSLAAGASPADALAAAHKRGIALSSVRLGLHVVDRWPCGAELELNIAHLCAEVSHLRLIRPPLFREIVSCGFQARLDLSELGSALPLGAPVLRALLRNPPGPYEISLQPRPINAAAQSALHSGLGPHLQNFHPAFGSAFLFASSNRFSPPNPSEFPVFGSAFLFASSHRFFSPKSL